jgi:putative membrane protein
MLGFLLTLLLDAAVVLAVSKVVPGVTIRGGYRTAVAVALVFGALHWALKTVLVLLTLPMVVLTFGLFLLVINAFLLWLTDRLLDGFEIRGRGALALATLGITAGSTAVSWLVDALVR